MVTSRIIYFPEKAAWGSNTQVLVKQKVISGRKEGKWKAGTLNSSPLSSVAI